MRTANNDLYEFGMYFGVEVCNRVVLLYRWNWFRKCDLICKRRTRKRLDTNRDLSLCDLYPTFFKRRSRDKRNRLRDVAGISALCTLRVADL